MILFFFHLYSLSTHGRRINRPGLFSSSGSKVVSALIRLYPMFRASNFLLILWSSGADNHRNFVNIT